MSTVLHIQAANRSLLSYSLRATQTFLKAYQETHPRDVIKTVDVWDAGLPPFDPVAVAGKYRLLHGQKLDDRETETWRRVEAVIAEFKAADKYVFSSPMWNFGIPYRLKQYFDLIVQPGYTFSYSPSTGYKGLVTGKPAVLVLARGGEYREGTAAYDMQRPYLELILNFMGITDIQTILIEPTLMRGVDPAEDSLAAAGATAWEMAKTF